MVGVAQLVEHQVVVLGVAGSSPVAHPIESAGREALAGKRKGLQVFCRSTRFRQTAWILWAGFRVYSPFN